MSLLNSDITGIISPIVIYLKINNIANGQLNGSWSQNRPFFSAKSCVINKNQDFSKVVYNKSNSFGNPTYNCIIMRYR